MFLKVDRVARCSCLLPEAQRCSWEGAEGGLRGRGTIGLTGWVPGVEPAGVARSGVHERKACRAPLKHQVTTTLWTRGQAASASILRISTTNLRCPHGPEWWPLAGSCG